MYRTLLYETVLDCTIPHYTKLSSTIPCCTVLYTIQYALYHAILAYSAAIVIHVMLDVCFIYTDIIHDVIYAYFHGGIPGFIGPTPFLH